MTGVDLLPETALALAASGLWLLVWILDLWSLRRARFTGTWPSLMACLGWLFVSGGIVIRWRAIGHPPVFGSYENSLAAAWFLLFGTLAIAAWPSWRGVRLVTLPVAVAAVTWGMFFNRNRIDLTISERSVWIDVHAAVAWVAFFALTAALYAAVLVILRARERKSGAEYPFSHLLPDARWSEDMVVQAVAWSFVGFSAVIVTGALYSALLFGEAWRWDGVEVLALITWLTMAGALHARLLFGWRGPRLAWLYIASYVGAVATYWLLALVPMATYHYFELPF